MARRYSQIKRGAEYDLALDNYITYIKNVDTRPTKRLQGGIRGARRQTLPVAIRPFGIELASGTYYASRIGQESSTELASVISSRVLTGATQLAAATRVERFRPARLTAFRGTGAATYVQSKVTKLYYLKYTGDSFSAPFGALTDVEEEAVGGASIKAAVLGLFGAADIKRISIAPEKVPV